MTGGRFLFWREETQQKKEGQGLPFPCNTDTYLPSFLLTAAQVWVQLALSRPNVFRGILTSSGGI